MGGFYHIAYKIRLEILPTVSALIFPQPLKTELARPGEFVLHQRSVVELSFLSASKTSPGAPALTRRRYPPMVSASFISHLRNNARQDGTIPLPKHLSRLTLSLMPVATLGNPLSSCHHVPSSWASNHWS